MRIALITDEMGWHSGKMLEALAQRGCEVQTAALPDCEFSTDAPGYWRIPGFSGSVPDGLFVRGVPSGSLEQIVFYLDVLHAMQRMGVTTYNDAPAIERSVDKVMTSFLLKRAGIATPNTWASVHREAAQARIEQRLRAGRRVVIKPVFGSQGKGLQLATPDAPLPELAEHSVYYLQDFIDSGGDFWHDWRLFVIGDRTIATMERVGRHWINNVAQGSECRALKPAPEMQSLAVAAVAAVGMAYGGVDLMKDAVGQLWVTEVNSIPAWKGLQSVSSTDIAAALADDFVQRIRCREVVG